MNVFVVAHIHCLLDCIHVYMYIYIYTCIDLDDFDIFLLPSFLTLILVSPSNARVGKRPTSGIQAAISIAETDRFIPVVTF